MSVFMQELLKIAKDVFPGADQAEILPGPKRALRLSWKTYDDPKRPSKRYQPIIIELRADFMPGALPEHVSAGLNKEFAAFVRHIRARFKPRTTESKKQAHTPDHWIFPPDA